MKNKILSSGRFVAFFLLGCLSVVQVSAQTTLISPTGDGGFQNGATFAANGWTVVNGSGVINQWFVGTTPTLFPTNSAYISNDPGGATHNYNGDAGSLVHFYRDITLPAGETSLAYSYDWYCAGESTFDFWQVSIGPTSITPTASSGIAGSSPLTTPLIPGTTVIGAHNLQGLAVQTVNATVSSAAFGNCNAPATVRIFFTWRNDGSVGNQPPAAIDNISLVSAVPTTSPISGTKTVGPGGDYATLTAAVSAINTNGVSSPVVLELLAAYTSASETFPIVLGPPSGCAPISSTNNVTIRPALGATALSITGANAGPTIDINGGNWWRIDGRPGGVGTAKELIISNTSTSGQAIRFINEGSNNIVRYCDVRGVNTSTVSGVILFSTTTGANGNDNNLIDNCDIRDGATAPINCVYGSGTSTTLATYNNNNTISNCNIFNYFSASSTHTGITLTTANSNYTITGNSFYQTLSRSTTATTCAVQLSSSLNNGIVISNNTVGGSAPNAGGSPLTYTGGAIFRGFLVTVGTTAASTIENNTFRNISVTSTSTSAFQGLISLATGRINVLNNTMGIQDGTNNIVFSLSGSAGRLHAIQAGTVTPELINITGNTIGGMALVVTGAPATVPAFFPISVQGTSAGHQYTVSNNLIGSLTTANSVTSDANSTLCGVISFSNAVGQTYNNNTIANLTASNTGTGASVNGMILQGSGTSPNFLGSFNVSGNTIRNLSTASGSTTFISAVGMSVLGTAEAAGASTITQNTIHSLINTNASAATFAAGMVMNLSTALSATVSRNFVHSLDLSTTATTANIRGIQINSGLANYANNFIRLGIKPDGTDITTGFLITGITEAGTAVSRLSHNSIYIGGAGVGAGSNTFALTVGSTAAGRDYRSNILVNARSNGAGAGKHYAISVPGTTPNPPGVASEYNLLQAPGTGGFIGLYNAVDQSTLANWRTASGLDNNSVSGNPQFINPTGSATTVDLHISTTNATPVEGGGVVVAGVTDDFDGQTRNTLSPADIGADAGNFILNDISGPGISYTPLVSICGTGNVSLNGVVITDATGIPTVGALIPRIYYRKGAGAWFSQPGAFQSGTAQNSTWNFTINVADVGGTTPGDVIQYYVIAQDIVATPNIVSVPGGVSATDVNTIITHPAAPASVTVITQLVGTYTVGAGGDFPTLTAAVAAYNSSCLGGAVVFSLTDATYPAETFPIVINANSFASAANTLTIRPAAGNTATISGASATGTALIRLNGADWVIIDGSNAGGTDRSLTLTNTSTATNVAVVWVSSVNAFNGATNNTIKNTNIVGGSNTVTSVFGIHVSGQTISTSASGDNNDNLIIQNNNINTAYYGLYARGISLANANDGLQIIGNTIGSANAANYVNFRGMDIHYANAPLISQNLVFDMINTLGTTIAGIDLGAGVINAQVVRNEVRNVQNTSTGGWGSYGIVLSSTTLTDGALIANNFISGMLGSNYFSGTTFHAYGIRLAGGTNTKVLNNSVNLFGPVVGGTSASVSACMIISTTSVTGTEIRNNIFSNTQEFAITGSNTYSLYLVSGVSVISNNNNFYGLSSANTTYHVGFNGTNRTTLANWQTGTSQDAQSFSVQPNFVSNADLHLTASNNQCLDGGGAPVAQVTVDYDGQARNATTPDIGADEFTNPDLSLTVTENSGLAANDNIVCGGADVTLTATGGGTYAWSTGFNGNPLVANPTANTTYTVTITNGSCTDQLSASVTVTSIPNFAVTGGGEFCAPGAGVPVGLAGSTSGISYQLQRNGVDVGASLAGTGAALSFGNQTVSGTYTVVASDAVTNCTATMSGQAVVTANATPVAFDVTGGGAYCTPGAGLPVGLDGSETGVSYQLRLGGVDLGAPVAGTGAALDFGNQATSGTYTVVATGAGACTTVMNGAAVVDANETPALSATLVEPTNCVSLDGAINLTVTGGTAPFDYNWSSPNGLGIVQGLEDQDSLTVGVYFVTVTSDDNCSATLFTTLNGPGNCGLCPMISTLSVSDATVCEDETVTLTATGLSSMGTTFGITFKYFDAPTATPYVGGTVIGTVPNSGLSTGKDTAVLNTSFADFDEYFVYAILDLTPTDPTCRPFAESSLQVFDVPSVNAVASQVVCNNASVAAITFSGPVLGTVFNWTNNQPSIGLAASGSGNIASFTATNTGTTPVVATITVTPVTNNAGATCTGDPITFTITVNPTPTVAAVANQVRCAGTATAAVNFVGTVSGTTFSWTNSAPSIGLAASGSGNIPSFTALNTGNAPVVATITVTPSANNCPGTPITFTITVNPNPTINALPNVAYCNGTTGGPIALTGPVPGTTYTWTNSNTAIGLGASGTGNIPTFPATNPGTAAITGNIVVTATYTNAGVTCPAAATASFVITVNPTPTVNQPANQVVCSGSATAAVAFSATVPGTVFNWTNNTPSIGLAASGSGNIPSFTAVNTGIAPVTATITVTPAFTNAGITCTGTPRTFTIIVNPTPALAAIPNQAVCNGQNTSAVTFTGPTGAVYAWTNSNPAIGLPASGTGNIPSFKGINNGATPISGTITVSPSLTANGITCAAPATTFTITVNPTPVVNAGADQAICPGESVTLSATGGTSCSWSPTTGLTGANTCNPVASPSMTTFYTVTVTNAQGCSGTDVVKVTVSSNQPLICNDNVQVSLGPDGLGLIDPDMILEGTYDDFSFYTVQVTTQQNQPVPNPVTCAQVGQTLKVRVTSRCDGNFCWGSIKVEDKLPPELTCNNVTVNCAVTNYTPTYLTNVLGIAAGNPTITDNCGTVTRNYTDELFDLGCDDVFNGISNLSAYVRRSWTAVDPSGNLSDCTQFIYFQRIALDDIDLPADVTVSCDNPNTGPSFTGAPTVQAFGQTFVLSPNNTFCELNAVYVDQELPVCDGTYKILRTWTLYDWCEPTQINVNPIYYIQVIKVEDNEPPVVECPTNITVGTNPFDCERDLNLPDVMVTDNCSRMASFEAKYTVNGINFSLTGSFSGFAGNNLWNPDTLGVIGTANNLPIGPTQFTYILTDDCGNTSTCAFLVTVDDDTPPVAACDEFTQVALGINGMAFINATTFDDGSYDNCSPVSFKVRRMDNNACQPSSSFYDQVKFCCEDINDTITVVLRVYDVPVPAGDIALDAEELNANDCMVQVFVEDKIKPACQAPANTTVSCENFDVSLWAYGQATASDNCCLDTITTTIDYSRFDSLCNRGTITRRFTARDCGGQTSQCSQRIIVDYEQSYFVRFPDDALVTFCDSSGVYGVPTFFDEDCELLGVSFEDEIFTVVPDACYKIERKWKIINWCSYDPNLPCINVPNPEPNATVNAAANRPGPIVSPAGTPMPWAPTIINIKPGQAPTNYSTFWQQNANCYTYTQVIKVIDTQDPIVANCPASPLAVDDITDNDGNLYNDMAWWDPITESHNLCEAPA
ncbi:MAG: PKD-like domain-containing protein, partial [Saprospiraceae bacterium]|nr:PKD-like domain-containing protein [Saprospiraceae bacterium]